MLLHGLHKSCFGGALLVCAITTLHCSDSAGEVGVIQGNRGGDAQHTQPIDGNGSSGSASQAGGGQLGGGSGGDLSTGTSGGGGGQGGGGGTTVPEAGTGAEGGVSLANQCDNRKVCDDFEKWTTGMQPGMPWKMRINKGTVSVDTTRAFSGKQSLKVAITATTASDTNRDAMISITGAPLLPVANNTVYGRFMVWTDRIPDKTVHWTTAHGDGPQSADGKLTATYNYGGMGDLMANYYRNTAPDPNDCWQTKDVNFPTNKWTCVAFVFNGPSNEMDYWQDGVEIPELHVLGNTKSDKTCTVKGVEGKWLAPTAWKNISIGWESYQHDASGAHDAWIDDVILDDKPVACPPAL